MASPVGCEPAAGASPPFGRFRVHTWLFPFLSLTAASLLLVRPGLGQQIDPLNQIHIESHPPAMSARAGATPTLSTDASLPGAAHFSIDTNLVLIPLTVTDPMDRLVTGLEKQNFRVYENNHPQTIRSFSCDDAPVSIGIILDLSGSMDDKVIREKDAILQFMKTSNPRDEYFLIGFNDRPVLLTDFTSSISDVESQITNIQPGHRTALLDAIYMGLQKMKQAKYQRKVLLVVSDGGDNNSRYTTNEVRNAVRESYVQIFGMGVFDATVATIEEQNGPLLLNEIAKDSGGRLYRVENLSEMSDIATRISEAIRTEYVLGYKTNDLKMNGKWRKVRVKLLPPPGLPDLTVHARSGYYAPLQ